MSTQSLDDDVGSSSATSGSLEGFMYHFFLFDPTTSYSLVDQANEAIGSGHSEAIGVDTELRQFRGVGDVSRPYLLIHSLGRVYMEWLARALESAVAGTQG